MITITDIKFTTPFSVSYLRNNRSSGQKSLRCFPRCTEKGHIASGFCGDHLIATATIKKNQACGQDWLDRITVIGEIRPFSDQGISSGKKVSRKKLLNELRDIRGATKSGGELLLGEMKIIHEDELNAVVTIAFNAEKHSWDYSWKSNRWSGVNNSHVVDVVLVESLTYMRDDSSPNDDDELDVYSSACGDTFLILSSHKSPHLKRKLSAAAAAAEDDVETGTETEIVAGTGSNANVGDAPDAYALKDAEGRGLRTSDPMSALLLALDDNSTVQHTNQLPLDRSSYTGDSCAPAMQESAAAVWEEAALLPPKRKRVKSLKMKEYSESFYQENADIADLDSHEEISSKGSIKSEPPSLGDTDCGMLSALGRGDVLERAYSSVADGRDYDNDADHDHDHDHEDEEDYQDERGGHGEDEALSSDGLGASSSSKYSISKEDLESADSKIFDLRWNETFAELVTYCDNFGHGNVPKDYKSPGGRWLGKWLDFQRQMKKKNRLRADRMVRLDRLVTDGFLNMYDGPRRGHRLSGENVHQWEGWYNALLEYGEINGTYNVPRHYVIPPSADTAPPVQLFNTVGKKLGRWLQTQRLRGRSGDLRGDRLKRLQELADTGRLDWLGNSVSSEKEKDKYSDAVCENEEDEGENSPSSSVVAAPVQKIFKVSGIQRSPPPNTRSRVIVKEISDPDSDKDQYQDLDQDQVGALDESHAKPATETSSSHDGSCSGGSVEGIEISHIQSHSQSRAAELKGDMKPMRKPTASPSRAPSPLPAAVAVVAPLPVAASAFSASSAAVPTGRVASPGINRNSGGDTGTAVVTGTAIAAAGAGAGASVGFDPTGRDDLHPHSPLNLNGLEALLFAATSH
jgi:Helicase associated domain